MSKYQKIISFIIRLLAFVILWEYSFVVVHFYNNLLTLAIPMFVLTFMMIILLLITRAKYPSSWKTNPALATLASVTGSSIGIFLLMMLFFL